MNDFRRAAYKIGTTIPAIPYAPPIYFGFTYLTTVANTCQVDYKTFDYSTAPEMTRLTYGDAVYPNRRIFRDYVGQPYATMNILSFTVTDNLTNVSVANGAKLYYFGTEVTSFPMAPIDMTGASPTTVTGLEIGMQDTPVCGANGSGITVRMNFSITDIQGLNGGVQTFTKRINLVNT